MKPSFIKVFKVAADVFPFNYSNQWIMDLHLMQQSLSAYKCVQHINNECLKHYIILLVISAYFRHREEKVIGIKILNQ